MIDKPRRSALGKLQSDQLDPEGPHGRGLNRLDLIAASRELIFDVVDGHAVFHLVMYVLDTDQLTIRAHHSMDLLFEDYTQTELEDAICAILGMATHLDVPVYPNNEKVVPLLERYQRRLYSQGFTEKAAGGKSIYFRLMTFLSTRIDDPRAFEDIDASQMVSPADLLLMRSSLTAEMERVSGAAKVVAGVKQATAELQALLSAPGRNLPGHSLPHCY